MAAVFAFVVSGRAQLGSEIARKHAERAGDRLAALTGLRAEGRTLINGEVVPFTLIAERPNRLRFESSTPRRRVVQGYDGATAPWISHSEMGGGTAQDMAEADARDFISNADFDGPLVNSAAKGFSVDYAGEEVIDGRRAFKLLTMTRRDEIFFLWVDAETYETIKRLVYRVDRGERIAIETTFKDFRPVGGVLQPHRIETTSNGQTVYVMVIDKMEANPVIPTDAFARP